MAESATRPSERPALIVFSHLRWNFVTQRPQHLLSRAAQTRPVYFWEEPILHDRASNSSDEASWLEIESPADHPNILVLRPHLFHGDDEAAAQRLLLDGFLADRALTAFDRWYYTPMALGFSEHLAAQVTVYDCMDELSAFLGAPAALLDREQDLFRASDVVFTGGRSLYEAKRTQHANIHAFPSSVDVTHFAGALHQAEEPADQRDIPHPRAGFFGVLDERFDVALVRELAELRPDVQFVFIGPVVKIDPATLPQGANLHYLGAKSYGELPAYLAGWDLALLPFAINCSTRFISPTKTPEYLAAGRRVISTPVPDVVFDYGNAGLVEIAADAQEFSRAIDRALAPSDALVWEELVAQKLASSSWDRTWALMDQRIEETRDRKDQRSRRTLHLASVRGHDTHDQELEDSFDYLVAGAGFSGAVVAERLASQLGKRVLVVDRRPHIGGNTYDFYNEHGILVHKYGPHIFHTSSQKVVDYLSEFTGWRPYEHRVLASVDGKYLPIPINLDTINSLFNLQLDSKGMEEFLAERVEVRSEIRTSEDIVLSRVGRELYEKFFRNYTRKQWGLDPSQLDACVAGRIPVRFNRDDRYFTDTFQAMPEDGFTRMFERILAHENITTMLATDLKDVAGRFPSAKIVYTGPIDEFFDYRFGRLPYRSLRFEHKTYDQENFQPAPVVNYPNDHEYTRITEFKYLTGQKHSKTSVSYEFPTDEGDPYYPIPRPENNALYERYRALAEATTGVYFSGRLANYRYFNMDQVVAQSLHLFEVIAEDEARAAEQRARKRSLSLHREPEAALAS